MRKSTFFPHPLLHPNKIARQRVMGLNYTTNGHLTLQTFRDAQQVAHTLVVPAADVNAGALVQTLMRVVIRWYVNQKNPNLFRQIAQGVNSEVLAQFTANFPPNVVFEGKSSSENWLYHPLHQEDAIEDWLLVGLANENPAFKSLKPAIDDTVVRQHPQFGTAWQHLSENLRTATVGAADGGGADTNLWDILLEPVRKHPDSLAAQLGFLKGAWGGTIDFGQFIDDILRAFDLIEEQNKALMPQGTVNFDWEGETPHTTDFATLVDEPEKFTEDRDWMPEVVMIAKSTLVWLDQLSKKYQRNINTLDQIPEEEYIQYQRWGINAIWLIGVWERSKPSQFIKQRMGNPEAAASAYSLYDYDVADELGGWQGYQVMKEKAWKYGVRIACDMVPNHTGLESRWIENHPEWFVNLPYPPYPSYQFNSENLSTNPDIGIYLEDHYYNRTDAAVVFKRVDFRNGSTHYIYHGNDGTGLPWNDTAQINFLHPEAKEAVIQTILNVARNFPIIRLDAAMVLAKKHIKRLWFPEPGKGHDAIASRPAHGLSAADFDRAMPEEFWREVVDRAAIEAPDTLLLAEAFWMLEGYFVRTLGMHRVYNSAFMHMLRDEKNVEFRNLIKETLNFDPDILQRYVNFLNNPDEKTAVEQFGKGDKYFGACLMMLTLPGLPMLGHGQIEGFSEKYGMEYRKAYHNETPDYGLIQHHERIVFPVAKKRYMFAGATYFRLFDCYNHGAVNEQVFAYTNRYGNEVALFLYNNQYHGSSGTLTESAQYLSKTDKQMHREHIAKSLALTDASNRFVIFPDVVSQTEMMFPSQQIIQHGLPIELGGYQTQVFLNVYEVEDKSGYYQKLWQEIGSRPVSSIEQAINGLKYQPLHTPFIELVESVWADTDNPEKSIEAFEHKYAQFLEACGKWTGNGVDYERGAKFVAETAKALIQLPKHSVFVKPIKVNQDAVQHLKSLLAQTEVQNVLAGWITTHRLGALLSENGKYIGAKSRNLMEAWFLDERLVQYFKTRGEGTAQNLGNSVKVVTYLTEWYEEELDPELQEFTLIDMLFDDPLVQQLCGVHQHENIRWFHKEGFERLLDLLYVIAAIRQIQNNPTQKQPALYHIYDVIMAIKKRAANAGYQVEKLKADTTETEEEEGEF